METEPARVTLQELNRRLEDPTLEPDRRRGDWAQYTATLAALRRDLEGSCAPREREIEGLPDARARDAARAELADTAAQVAAVHGAAGQREAALELLRRAIALAPTWSAERALLVEAGEQLDSYVQLAHGLWLQRTGRAADAAPVLAVLFQGATPPGPAIAAAAQRALPPPPPPASVEEPVLFRGRMGIALFGKRDRREDGSYVKTTCLTLIGIPLFPLDAYRIRETQDGEAVVLDREPLSRLARIAQIGVIGAFTAVVLVIVVRAFLVNASR